MSDDQQQQPVQQQCPGCSGKGRIQVQRAHDLADNAGGAEYEEQSCPGCGGTGWVEGGSR